MCFSIHVGKVDLFTYDIDVMEQSMAWSDTLNEILWELARLPCAWNFDRMRKVCDEVVIVGRCKSFGCSRLFAYTESAQSTIKITIKDVNTNIAHLHKRFTKYAHKSKVDDLLLLNKACVVRSKLANSLMTDNEHEPPHLPTNATLRVQKHRMTKTDYLHENPIVALRMMKNSPKYFDSIGDIGLDPFYCVYSTPLQREVLRVQTRYRRCVISFDASGIHEKPPEFSSQREFIGEFKRTFMYIITLLTEDFNTPVHQFLSQRQNSDFISYKLDCWKYKSFSKKNPNEVIMDDSSAVPNPR